MMSDDTKRADREAVYREGASWAAQQRESTRFMGRVAWIVAGTATLVAALEAIALVTLTPLKTVVPYTLLVDRQTGYVQALKPLEREAIAPDRALTRSLLAQYVIAREGFDIDTLRDDYRKVVLSSADEARDRYIASMQSTNPASPLATLPRRALVQVQIASVNSLNDSTALVRFTTSRTDPGGQPTPPQHWASVLTWRYSAESMSDADRLTNPLGFQVVRYRRSAEDAPPEAPPAQSPAAAIMTNTMQPPTTARTASSSAAIKLP